MRCLLTLFIAATSAGAQAATYWRVEQSGITVFAEGDKDTAVRVLETALRLQSAARWLLDWPSDHREPPGLIFVVGENVLRHTFKFSDAPIAAYTDYTAGHEVWARTPSMIVVAVSPGYRTGEELRPLQHAYSEALLKGETSRDWPRCVLTGMSLLLTSAELTPPNHFMVSGHRLRGPTVLHNYWSPERFLVPRNALLDRMPQSELDDAAYACVRLSFMIGFASPDQRSALERMLTAVGRGTPLVVATTAELNQSLPEFATIYHEFNLEYHDIRIDLADEIPPAPEPAPVSPDDVHALMVKVCSRLNDCRR